MSDNNLSIRLHLPKSEGMSALKVEVFQEELEQINEQFPLEKGQINVSKTYILDNDDHLEVGIFIRSTVKNDITIEEIELGLEDKSKMIILSQRFNFKDIGVIPTYTGVPAIIKFKKNNEFKHEDFEDYSINFITQNNLQGFLSVNPEIENLPNDISFEEEKEILDFIYNLKTIKANEISLSTFKLTKLESGTIVVDVLIRNGYNKEVNLEQIPVAIMDDNNTFIARNVFENPNGIVKVSPYKAKLAKFIFKSENIYTAEYNITKCRVVFQ